MQPEMAGSRTIMSQQGKLPVDPARTRAVELSLAL